jgi:hypothetical protein
VKKTTIMMYVQPKFETVASPGVFRQRGRRLFEHFGKISLSVGGKKYVKKFKGTSASPDYARKLGGIPCKDFWWQLISGNTTFRFVIEFFTALTFAAALINFAPAPVAPRHPVYSATTLRRLLVDSGRGQFFHYQTRRGGEKMKIDLTIREAPPEGAQTGVFVDVIPGETTDKRGKKFKTLTLLGQLVAVNSNGKRFMARKTYKVDDTRGVNKLIGDLKVWRGSDALPNLGEFNPEAEFLDKPFTCDHSSTEENGAKVIQIGDFKPNSEAKITATDYARKPEQPAPA